MGFGDSIVVGRGCLLDRSWESLLSEINKRTGEWVFYEV
jgi:hypothetical protein